MQHYMRRGMPLASHLVQPYLFSLLHLFPCITALRDVAESTCCWRHCNHRHFTAWTRPDCCNVLPGSCPKCSCASSRKSGCMRQDARGMLQGAPLIMLQEKKAYPKCPCTTYVLSVALDENLLKNIFKYRNILNRSTRQEVILKEMKMFTFQVTLIANICSELSRNRRFSAIFAILNDVRDNRD
uniref:Secreted protein n=1 Tax=Timema bartmani TaxID=61472 RepID=A0A7R9F726_9NEOP|nr:unnamed protein product [Timema bartmani]